MLSRLRQPGVLATVALGGALGSMARYEITRRAHVAPGTFPWATFAINVSGALVLGVLLTLAVERMAIASPYPRALVGIGFLGAFTTFSTMAMETVTLVKDGDAPLGLSYLLVSVAAGIAAAAAGMRLARVGAPTAPTAGA